MFIAVDLGAESGRVVAGMFDGRKLELREVHRFVNAPVQIGMGFYWNILGLFSEIKNGIRTAVQECNGPITSLGVDAWGVDYALVDIRGALVENPRSYRDPRTKGMQAEAFLRVPRRDIYEATGIQFMEINTLYQLMSEIVAESPTVAAADRLLFIPDLINYWLTGRKSCERTIASTGQIIDPRTGDWAYDMLEKLGIPTTILGEIVEPGSVLGHLQQSIRDDTGAGAITVVAPGCHDTASAVAAIPAEIDRYAYISSGTWSLMGIESPEPVINDGSYAHDFTNEGGVCDTIRVLKNISGMWMVQECRRTWAGQGDELNYAQMTRLAGQSSPFVALLDPDDPDFLAPGDMPARIVAYCHRTGQTPPEDKGSILRTALESLALRYWDVMVKLEDILGYELDVIHIVGGGTQNTLLNQMAADAVGKPVVSGPVEATSAGNILMQMLASGDIASLQEGRQVIANSFSTETYEPQLHDAWDQAFERFKELP